MKTIVKTYLAVIGVSLVCFVLLPNVEAVVPPPDGGYPGGNTAEGQNALFSRTTGGYNTAVGFFSLRALTGGSFNTATGAGTLLSNTGDENTATGAGGLLSNTSGAFNTAVGGFALLSNQGGLRNTAVGSRALFAHTMGDFNNAVGAFALASDTVGQGNNAVGRNALSNNTAGSDITALGAHAGEAVTMVDHVICIGHPGANLSNSCFIGNIYGALIDPGTATSVGIDASGRLGTTTSSRRFKRDIKPMNNASEAIHSLNPVAFHYKSDAKNTPCFGLIAEEVAEVNPDLVVRDRDGQILSVRYDQVNAMLLNEFLKEHQKVQEQEAAITQLNSKMDSLIAHIKEQDSKIQKVSDELEIRNATAQVAARH